MDIPTMAYEEMDLYDKARLLEGFIRDNRVGFYANFGDQTIEIKSLCVGSLGIIVTGEQVEYKKQIEDTKLPF